MTIAHDFSNMDGDQLRKFLNSRHERSRAGEKSDVVYDDIFRAAADEWNTRTSL